MNSIYSRLNHFFIRFVLVLILCGNYSNAQARNLEGRFGLGYNSQFSSSNYHLFKVPALSIKYAFTQDYAIEGIVGAASTSPVSTVAAIKVFKNIFYENNLNFYFLLGGGLVSGFSQTGIQILTGFGVEFFIPGIESLGLSVEVGANGNNSSGTWVVSTMGMSFLEAGIRFYF